MLKGADIDGQYRYGLWRIWNGAAPLMGVVMYNPSTADADTDDPTIRRLNRFAQRDGYGGIYVVNMFAYRTSVPSRLKATENPIGPRNDEAIIRMAQQSDIVLCAWGATPAIYSYRTEQVKSMLWTICARRCIDITCLGFTKNRSPRHPLYVRADMPLVHYCSDEAFCRCQTIRKQTRPS